MRYILEHSYSEGELTWISNANIMWITIRNYEVWNVETAALAFS